MLLCGVCEVRSITGNRTSFGCVWRKDAPNFAEDDRFWVRQEIQGSFPAFRTTIVWVGLRRKEAMPIFAAVDIGSNSCRLKIASIGIDRKVLSDLAIVYPAAFTEIVKAAGSHKASAKA